MKTVATICARGGSVGVPKKNIRLLLGKPLIAYTIEQALACSEIDGVYVSTDDAEIASVAIHCGAKVLGLRPPALATSSAAKLPVIQHLVKQVEDNISERVMRIVDLDPTSPLREQTDILECMALLDSETDVVITGYESEKNPYFNMVETRADGTIDLVKHLPKGVASRQQAPKVYAMNASIYVWHRHTLKDSLWGGKVRLHVMPRERSVDIDSLLDFRLVEMLMREQAQRK